MEPASQLVEQRGQITVRGDRLQYGQQGPVQVAGGSCLSVEARARHGETLGRNSSETIKRSGAPLVSPGVCVMRILPILLVSECSVRFPSRELARFGPPHLGTNPPNCSGPIDL